MEKKFYILAFVILCSSVLLLGFSYSKTSGVVSEPVSIYDETDSYKVIYSNDEVLSMDNKSVTFRFINKSNDNVTYRVKIKKDNLNDVVYYKVDDNEESLLSDMAILEMDLGLFGSNNDSEEHTISIRSNNGDGKYQISFTTEEDNELKYYVMKDSQVYQDDNGSYRYYGIEVNNYINYQGVTYRMLGYIDGRIKVISLPKNILLYDYNGEYLEVFDLLRSYENGTITEVDTKTKKTWLQTEENYWIKSSSPCYLNEDYGIVNDSVNNIHYTRFISYIDSNLVVTSGNGTVDSPYEVEYGS